MDRQYTKGFGVGQSTLLELPFKISQTNEKRAYILVCIWGVQKLPVYIFSMQREVLNRVVSEVSTFYPHERSQQTCSSRTSLNA